MCYRYQRTNIRLRLLWPLSLPRHSMFLRVGGRLIEPLGQPLRSAYLDDTLQLLKSVDFTAF